MLQLEQLSAYKKDIYELQWKITLAPQHCILPPRGVLDQTRSTKQPTYINCSQYWARIHVSGKLPQEKPWNSELVLTLEKGKGMQFRNQFIQKWKEESNVCHQQPIWQNSVDPPNESQDIRQSSGYPLIIDQLSWFSPDFYKLSVRFILSKACDYY